MQIYLDSGDLKEIEEVAKLGLISGVTTNPTLVQKFGSSPANNSISFPDLIKSIVKILKEYCHDDFTVSAEVLSKDSKGMIAEAEKLAKIDRHVIIKIPITKEGLIAVEELAKKRIRTNVTLIFSANQALLAAKAGAYIVSPFVGRLDDIGIDGIELVKEIKTIYKNYDYKTKIITASVRSSLHVKNAALAGTDIATIPYKILMQLYNHPLTDVGIRQFDADWSQYLQSKQNLHIVK